MTTIKEIWKTDNDTKLIVKDYFRNGSRLVEVWMKKFNIGQMTISDYRYKKFKSGESINISGNELI